MTAATQPKFENRILLFHVSMIYVILDKILHSQLKTEIILCMIMKKSKKIKIKYLRSCFPWCKRTIPPPFVFIPVNL